MAVTAGTMWLDLHRICILPYSHSFAFYSTQTLVLKH